MKDEAVHITVHFRLEGDLVQNGVNVTVFEFDPETGEPVYNRRSSQFVCIRHGNWGVWIRIPKYSPKDYSIKEETYDPAW